MANERTRGKTRALSLAEVCARLRVASKAVMILVKLGKLVGYQVGRQWRFDDVDVEAFIDAQKAIAAARVEVPRPHLPANAKVRAVTRWKGSDRYLK